MRTFSFYSLMLVATLVAANAFAHQQKAAITKVLFNPRTTNIEIMHRFYIHDAEHAVKEIIGKQADILSSAQTQQHFADYVASRFVMTDQDGNYLNLKAVGYEVDGQHFWVYQETPQSANLVGLKIQHSALQDIWSQQTNTVNIEGVGDIKTLTFEQNVELLEVTF
ncbi:DUF6702 family protein [Aliiglaciecola litoralis]|uniref:Orphan protein n=1 Tax=Aliiglaciecola litoralis TaxID=582857 RepID=A0ABP3WR27_9ALTE